MQKIRTGMIHSVALVMLLISADVPAGIMMIEPARLGPPQRLFVLSIGINKYPPQGTVPSIAFAENDARSVAEAFSPKPNPQPIQSLNPAPLSPQDGVIAQARVDKANAIAGAFSRQDRKLAFPEVFTKTLLGSDATLDAIRDAMRAIALRASASDAFLFYFGGMGLCLADGEPYTFAVADTLVLEGKKPERPLRASDLATLLLQVPAKRQIVVLDTCDSRRAADTIRAAMDTPDSFRLDAMQSQVSIFATSGPSLEFVQLEHGLLTYCLLQAMAGGADFDHSGVITAARLQGYLTWKVPESFRSLEGEGVAFEESLYAYSTMRELTLTGPAAGNPPSAPSRGSRRATPENGAAGNDLGKDYLLIVAADHYTNGWRDLNNAVRDATAVRDELIHNYGFSPERVTELIGAKKSDLILAINKFNTQSFGFNDRLLVYIAGHGFRDENDGWLIFKDSRSPEGDVDYESSRMMGFSRIRNVLEVSPIRHVLLIMDVCYGGTFEATGGFQGMLGGAAKQKADRDEIIVRALKARSRIYITSGDAKHEVSDGEPGGHSPFTTALLAELATRGGPQRLMDVATLYQNLRGELPLEPRAGYFDRTGTEQNADFVLIPSNSSAQSSRFQALTHSH